MRVYVSRLPARSDMRRCSPVPSYRLDPYPVVILAAGAGRRMGTIKSRIEWRGRSLLEDAIARARQVSREVHVMSGAGYPFDRFRTRIQPSRWWFVPDWRQGQSRSLRAALVGPGSRAKGVLVMLVDQPLVPVSHLQSLMAKVRAQPTEPIASEAEGVTMAPAWLPRRIWPELASLRGDQGAGRVLRQLGVETLSCPEAGQDLDTPAQLLRARQIRFD